MAHHYDVIILLLTALPTIAFLCYAVVEWRKVASADSDVA